MKHQGLCSQKLDIVFWALIVSKITYALPAWGGFLNCHLRNSINSFFKRAYRFQLVSKILTIESLLEEADKNLFKSITQTPHCLSNLLPPPNIFLYSLRERGHLFTIPSVATEWHKNSFINRALFHMK